MPADKDTEILIFFFVCIKYFQNSRTNFTFLGMWRRIGLDKGLCCSILYVNEHCSYHVRKQTAGHVRQPDWSEGM